MRRYSVFQAIALSLFSRALYRDVAKSWRGSGLIYLLIVVAILAFLVLVSMQIGLNRWVRGPAQGFAEQIPTIVIRQRVVEIDCSMPYAIEDPKTGEEVAVIDTTGLIGSLDSLEARVLLTADQLHYRRSTAETRVFSLAGIQNLTITSTKVKHWLTLLSFWAVPALAPFVFGGLFVFRLFQVVLFAVVGLLVAKVVKAPLQFAALMRLSAVSMTPVLVLEPVLDWVGWKPPGWAMIWTVLALGYLVWGILSSRPQGEMDAPVASPEAPTESPPA